MFGVVATMMSKTGKPDGISAEVTCTALELKFYSIEGRESCDLDLIFSPNFIDL
jgi:hypothetical protein